MGEFAPPILRKNIMPSTDIQIDEKIKVTI
jgi:hypothetical protein